MSTAWVVDDDSEVRSMTVRYLTKVGYDVETFADFHGAMAGLHERSPEMLVVDVRLGDFNGLQLGFAARDRHPEVSIVVISAWDDPVLRDDAAKCRAVYLTKPFHLDQMAEAMRQAALLAKPSL